MSGSAIGDQLCAITTTPVILHLDSKFNTSESHNFQSSLLLTQSYLDDYLKFKAHIQSLSPSVAFVAQCGNSIACLAQSSSWIVDSNASEHLSSNEHLLNNLTMTTSLPRVTLANGSKSIA
ncbi:hypothetical protein ACH5RR_003212 [Cinchona calisaya]|uniref:Uncharacterized protein n=1 Tax=Cinchona calisaya TaxID=153742 RepID=A0ABD3AU68_9GENT